MKGQFMALTAVLVSIIVLSMTGIITEFQSQNYPDTQEDRVIDMIKEEAGKVDVAQPEERRSFTRFVQSVPNYRAETTFDNTRQCFEVILERSNSRITMDCVGGEESKVEEVRLISIGYDARQDYGGNAPVPPRGTESSYGGVYDAENNRQLHSAGRSYSLSVYDLGSNTFLSHQTYDIYDEDDGESKADQMANDIQSMTDDEIALITTQNEPQNHRLHGDLEDAMYNLGASQDLYGAGDSIFKNRSAYLLVGRPDLGEGNAYIEKYAGEVNNSSDAWVKADFKLS
ncbi:MAG: hypothetical protein ACI977_000431 [Candidatus Nanohaloarchaea archaeon]|jgi:hypothetical protein